MGILKEKVFCEDPATLLQRATAVRGSGVNPSQD